jgi:ABC-2 type transport system permease protein
MLHRVVTLIIKELLMIMRSRQSRMIVFMPVLMQAAVFPFAATLEVRNAEIGIYNDDGGEYSIEITQRLAMASAFSRVILLRDDKALAQAVNDQGVLLALRFPPDFSRKAAGGEGATLQIILDGRRSNAGQIALNYVQNILLQYQDELLARSGRVQPLNARLEFRNWYNPNLDYKWFVLPSLVAMITTIGVMIFTALSVAREREQGTLDQLLVSPLSTGEIFIGKAVPAVIVAILQGSMVLVGAIVFYRIPFSGSLILFYMNILLYGLSLVGVGLLISALCGTQQQALIGVFLFLMPAIILSGYLTPVENMAESMQYLTLLNPVRHFTEITKQIYLKDADFSVVWQSMWPLILIMVFSVAFAFMFFRRKIE